MRQLATIGAFVVLLGVGGYGVFAGHPCLWQKAGAPVKNATAGATAASRATGAFNPAMSGVCRFSCAAQQPYEEKDVAPQPGAVSGRLTRCPVSGVVFAVDDRRPRVRLASGEYVLCCDRCAEKLRKDPGRFVRI